MRFEKGAEVFTATGEKVGTISRIVIDTKTKEVTDIVVERGAVFKREKVIPIGLVDLEKDDSIMLRETNQGVEDFPDYETTHYVPVDPHDTLASDYWYPPLNFPIPESGMLPGEAPDYGIETEDSIPEGRVAVSEGARVISADETHIGNIEQVITNSESNAVTHFVVGKGILLKEHKIVPLSWVNNVEEEEIQLSVEAELFDRLPDYNPD